VIVACFASIPDRVKQLKLAVASVYHQVDRIYVYCNGLSEPPPSLRSPKIEITLSRESGWKGSEAKFWWSAGAKFRQHSLTDVDAYFTCDDDILYPHDYVKKMLEALERHPGCAVGVHGVRVKDQIVDYYKALDLTASFQQKLAADRQVHILGTGTMVYRPKDFELSFEKFYVPNMADLWFAIQARENGRELWCVERPKLWLRQQAVSGVSISAMKSSGRAQAETELLQLHAPWPALSDQRYVPSF